MLLIISFILAIFLSWMLTGVIRKYALSKKLLDIPNARSSHSIPVPRGGGLAIGLTFLTGMAALYFSGNVNIHVVCGLLGAGILVGLIGFLDDHGHIPARWRLLAHFAAAAWALIWLGEKPELILSGIGSIPGWVAYVIAAVCLVWLLNLFNFMDGIDGIASSEAIFVAFSGFLIAHHAGNASMALVAIILIGSVLGFLVWNWPPAKIFMGDVGSGFLGIVIGVYAYWAMVKDVVSFWTWLILFGLFWIDATFTLGRRILGKAVWYEAHKSHAYQHAAQKWGHLRVTVAVSVINITWLLPIAYVSNIHRDWGAALSGLALTPIVVLVFSLGAGKELK